MPSRFDNNRIKAVSRTSQKFIEFEKTEIYHILTYQKLPIQIMKGSHFYYMVRGPTEFVSQKE